MDSLIGWTGFASLPSSTDIDSSFNRQLCSKLILSRPCYIFEVMFVVFRDDFFKGLLFTLSRFIFTNCASICKSFYNLLPPIYNLPNFDKVLSFRIRGVFLLVIALKLLLIFLSTLFLFSILKVFAIYINLFGFYEFFNFFDLGDIRGEW